MVDIDINKYLSKKDLDGTISNIKESIKQAANNIKDSTVRSIDIIASKIDTSYISKAKVNMENKMRDGIIPNINRVVNVPDIVDKAKQQANSKLYPLISSVNSQIDRLDPLRERIVNFPKKMNIRIQKLNEYNIFDKVHQLQYDVENIKIWRNDKIDPSLIEVYNNITSILDKIQNDIYPSVLNAATLAEASKNSAISAMNYAKTFVLRLQLSGEVLELGIKDILASTIGLQNTFKNESLNIYNYWNDFGINIMNRAVEVKDSIIDLGYRFTSAAISIGSKLADLADHIDSGAGDASKAYDKARDGDFVDAIKYTKHAINDSLRGLEDLKDLAGRIIGGFNSVGVASQNTANSFNDFGNSIYGNSNSLASKFNLTLLNFKTEIVQYTGVYKRVFDDMKTVFTSEYTNENLAKEIERREKEREIYSNFIGDLTQYESIVINCKSATFELPIRQNEYNEALYKFEIMHQETIKQMDNLRERILVEERRIVYNRIPAGNVERNTVRISTPINVEYILSINIDDDYFNKEPQLSTRDQWDKVGWRIGNKSGSTSWHLFLTLDRLIYNYKMLAYDRKQEIKRLQGLKEQIDNMMIIKTEACSQISPLLTKFINKWNVTPEEGSNLTYEQIINLNK